MLPPGLEPFPLTGAILAIVAVIVFPVVRAYRDSVEKRLADKDAVIAQERLMRAEEVKRTAEEHDRELARRDDAEARLLGERDRFIDMAVEGAAAAREATLATRSVVSIAEGRPDSHAGTRRPR